MGEKKRWWVINVLQADWSGLLDKSGVECPSLHRLFFPVVSGTGRPTYHLCRRYKSITVLTGPPQQNMPDFCMRVERDNDDRLFFCNFFHCVSLDSTDTPTVVSVEGQPRFFNWIWRRSNQSVSKALGIFFFLLTKKTLKKPGNLAQHKRRRAHSL